MAFGISLGKNKEKIDKTTTVNKTESTNQTGSETTTGSKSSQTSSTGSQTSQSAGQTSSSQQGVTASQGTGVQKQVESSTAFGEGVLEQIESALAPLFAQTAGSVNAESLNDFDKSAFISNGLARARSQIESSLGEAKGTTFSAIGGTAETNSAAAELAQRLDNQAASEFAGIEADLTATAEGINRDNLSAASSIGSQDQQFLVGLLETLKGGRSESVGAAETATSETGSQSQTAASQTSEQAAQQNAQQTTAVENLVETLNSLLVGVTNTTGTENTKGKVSKSGGGVGLSI